MQGMNERNQREAAHYARMEAHAQMMEAHNQKILEFAAYQDICFRMQQTNLGGDLSSFPQSPMWLPPYPPIVPVPPGNMHWEGGGYNEDDMCTQEIHNQDSDGEGTVDLNLCDDGA